MVGQRFLDNVTDVTRYPLKAQEDEQKRTRRTGLGFSGLATAMAQLGIRYGSTKAVRFAGEVSKCMAFATYEASIQLAEERGAFPEYDEKKFWHESSGFAAQRFKGTPLFGRPLRNGVCNTLAPVGSGSIIFGNIDSGLEPIWALEYDRKVRQRDDTYKTTRTMSMTARLWRHLNGDEAFPRHITTASDLKVHEHILIQEACQQWIDASISKTINIPADMPYEEFVAVYDLAFEAGLKGCTTYRPSELRGSILGPSPQAGEQSAPASVTLSPDAIKRPEYLSAEVAKLRWPGLSSSAYVTLSRLEDGSPFEVFLSSKDQRQNEWMTTSTLLMSWLLRMGVPLQVIAEELQKVQSLEGFLVDRKYRPSLVSYIASKLLEMDARFKGDTTIETPEGITIATTSGSVGMPLAGPRCPECRSPNIKMKQGCQECQDCGHSKCG
jgi:ribonucleoside-diphosphate reductase alpha chain